MSFFKHESAVVSDKSQIGDGSYIWQNVQVRPMVTVGTNCILGKGAFIDYGVNIGSNVKIQNYVNIYRGVTIEDGVMVGPSVCFTNDLFPRAINADGSLQSNDDWICYETHVKRGAAIGAGSIIVCNTTIGKWSIIGAGSVVTKNVPDYALVYGNPARVKGFVCPCGQKLPERMDLTNEEKSICPQCKTEVTLPVCTGFF